MDRIRQRLSGFSAKSLSLAGRLVLVKSVLCSILYYSMQTSKFPKLVCNKIEELVRGFLWHGSNNFRSVHLVNWEEIREPLYSGDLGIRRPRLRNSTFLMKLGFGLISNCDLLWAQMLLGKYRCRSFANAAVTNGQRVSRLWRAVVQLKDEVVLGLKWVVGSGTNIHFWSDAWVGELGPLANLATCPIFYEEREITVREMCKDNGEWNWGMFEGKLPTSVLIQIASIHLPSGEEGVDTVYWNRSSNGDFTIRSAYQQLSGFTGNSEEQVWKAVWSWGGPKKIKMFLWLCFREKLLTNVERRRRHLTDFVMCQRCQRSDESITHVLRDYSYSRQVWIKVIKNGNVDEFFHGGL